jgi:hypothetical protein
MRIPKTRTILLWSTQEAGQGWSEKISIEPKELRDFERIDSRVRFSRHELVADLVWSAGLDKSGRQSSRLQPMNSLELRALAMAAIELAGEMERAQEENG